MQGRAKCNIDGAWFQQEARFGVGICLRDRFASFISAKTIWLNGVLKPPEIKVFGLLEALCWIHQLGIQQVDFELDCKHLVDAVIDRLRLAT